MTDRNFYHLGPFYALLPPTAEKLTFWEKKEKHLEISLFHICVPKNLNDMTYSSREMVSDGLTFVISCNFLPFYLPKTTKNQNLKKIKIAAGDIIILHMCTKNDNHMMYGSWDMECHKHNFLSFWVIFWPFTPLTIQNIKILEKWKKHLDILLFYTCVP